MHKTAKSGDFAERDIPINLLIEKNSKQGSNEVYNCEVIGVNTNAYDKVTFLFKERQYTRYYSLAGFPKGEIRKLYHVRLEVAESIFNTYSVKSLELERNEK